MKKYPPIIIIDKERRSEILNAKTMPIVATGKSYRVINSWESNGLIDNFREENSRWRKFSLVDCVWIKIISDLRDFGFSTEKIKNVKANLWQSETGMGSQLFQLVQSYTSIEFKLLLVFLNGRIELLSSMSKKKISKLDSHICLNLSSYFDYFVENEFRDKYHKELSDYYV